MRSQAGDHEIDDDPDRVDVDTLWAWLSTEAYWGRWRTRDVVERQLRGAWRIVAAYDRVDGRMVGFARAVSDGEGFAYLADVWVAAAARGHGLGTAVVRAMIDDGPGASFRWMLHTRDAHGLYAKFGFVPASERVLEREVDRPG